MHTRFRTLAAVFAMSVAGACSVWGQVVGAAISGVVHDETGAPIAAANGTVQNVETAAERKLVTDDSGHYAAPSIPVGRYEVTGSKTGFTSQTKTGLNLVVGQN